MVFLARVGDPEPDYAALRDALNALPAVMQEARATQGMTTGAQARQVGVSSSSLSRLGPTSTIKTAAACFAWLANRNT